MIQATLSMHWTSMHWTMQGKRSVTHLMALSLMRGSSYWSMMALNLGDLRRNSRLGSFLTLLYCSNPAESAASSASRPASVCGKMGPN